MLTNTSVHNLIIKRFYIKYDVVVIGGGIIGTAISRALKLQNPERKIALFEKESKLGQHQTSHNSGVIHCGIYYKPQSLKAQLCVRGLDLIYEYCTTKQIPFKKSGKLIIAKDSLEKHRLNILHKRGQENNIKNIEVISDWDKIDNIQPFCQGVKALWSPNTGNVDFKTITNELAKDFLDLGGKIHFNSTVKNVKLSVSPDYPVLIETTSRYACKYVVVCIGLNSGQFFAQHNMKQVSFRVKYGVLNKNLSRFIKTNIYGMPEVGLPFLGVHFTPKLDGNVSVIVSALPACKIDGYKNDLDLEYVTKLMNFQGFPLMLMKNVQIGLEQIARTFSKTSQLNELKKYFPMLAESDVENGPVGVQTQLIDNNGEFYDDFFIDMFNGDDLGKRVVNCRFIPSPGATASLAIGEYVACAFSKVNF